MATKPKKYTYQIQYTDNTYRMVDWTNAEWDVVTKHMGEEQRLVLLDDGIFVLTDIRTIVNIPIEEPEPTEEGQPENEGLGEWNWTDPATLEWLKEQGIDTGKVSK